jgi:hypothetical protein
VVTAAICVFYMLQRGGALKYLRLRSMVHIAGGRAAAVPAPGGALRCWLAAMGMNAATG